MQGRSTSAVTNVDSQLAIAKSRPTDLERSETDDLGRSEDRTFVTWPCCDWTLRSRVLALPARSRLALFTLRPGVVSKCEKGNYSNHILCQLRAPPGSIVSGVSG